MAARFQPFDPGFLHDPYPTYAALRERDPISRFRVGPVMAVRLLRRFARARRQMGEPGLPRTALAYLLRRRSGPPRGSSYRPRLRTRIYSVSRYQDVCFVLRQPELFSSIVMGGAQAEPMTAEGDIAPTSGSLIGLDPPEHGRHRGIVNRGFTPRRIADLKPRIRKIAEERVASFELRGTCELMAEFANPLPVAVIAELLGLDPARRDDFKRWSTALIVGSTQGAGGPRIELFREFRRYMSEVVEARRRQPGEDLISALIDAEQEGGILDTEQVISFASLLLAAGSETTTNLIGNAVVALLEHPEQLARVREDPSYMPQLVEETLRYDSPVQLLMRLATRDVELAGVSIPARSMLIVLLGSANRDAAQFPDPDRFDLARSTQGHVAFGLGNHFCLGASLARLEGRIALETLRSRLPDLRLATPRVERHGSFLVRGPSALPLAFGTRRRVGASPCA